MDKKQLTFTTAESFFMTWALSKVFSLNPGNIFNGVIFVLGMILISYIKKVITEDKKTTRVSQIISLIFALCIIEYGRDAYVSDLSNRLFKAIILFSVFVGLFTFFYFSLRYLFYIFADKDIGKILYNTDEESKIQNCVFGFYSSHIQISTFVLCLICFLPFFLYQFPGIMTPDSIVQYEQALHITGYSNHHPWIHTLIIELFYNLGRLFTTSDTVAASFYSIAQMCFMAFSASYVVGTLSKLKVKDGICLVFSLFYALVPYNAVFSITVWKDIPFAGIVAIFVCLLIRTDMYIKSENKSRSQTIKYITSLVVSGVGVCLFRSNGLYAFIALTPFVIIHFKNVKKYAFGVLGAVFAIVIIFKIPIMNLCNVSSPDMVESLSIPLQQVANVLVNDREIPEADMREIKKVVDLTYIDELYEPTFADNVKEMVRAGDEQYLIDNKWYFAKMYLRLGAKYPADYLKAYVMQTYGYYYPDRDYYVADAEGVVGSKLNIVTTPVIAGPVVVKAKEVLIKLGDMIPVYSLLWSMGTIFFVLIFMFGLNHVRGCKKDNIYLLPYLLLVLTVLIATPVSTEFRYVYFMMFGIPVILLGRKHKKA